MARVSKADRLKRYRHQLDIAKKWRQTEGYDKLWRRMIDLYSGKHFGPGSNGEDRIAVNIVFSTINVMFPAVSVSHPKMTVLANDSADEDKAVILESVLNYWWRHYDFHPEFRSATKDSLLFGHGWLKAGWKYTTTAQPHTVESYDQQMGHLQGQADDYAAQNPEMAHAVPTNDEIHQSMDPMQEVVEEDRPFVERVSPFDVFVDPSATSIQDAKWICQRIIRTLEDCKADERYTPVGRSALKPDTGIKDEYRPDQTGRHDPDVEWCTVYEWYDIKKGTWAVCSEMGDKFLIEPAPVPYPYGHPFIFIPNYEVPDRFYPMGDLEQLASLQDELNKTRSQMMNHRKKFARKTLFYESAFDSTGREALQSDQDNRMVPVIDETRPLDQVAKALEQVPVPPELYSHSDIIEGDIDKVSGINEYARGAAPDIRRTATEAAIIQDAANSRAADKLAAVERVIAEIARKLAMLGQEYLTGDQVARLVGVEGQMVWVPYNQSDITGEFDYAVEGGSTQPNNETFRRQTAVALMQTIGPLVGTVIDPMAIARHLLQEGFGVKNPEKFLIDPQQQMLMQQQQAAAAGQDPNAPPGADPNGPQSDQQGQGPPEQGQGQAVPPQDANSQGQGQVGPPVDDGSGQGQGGPQGQGLGPQGAPVPGPQQGDIVPQDQGQVDPKILQAIMAMLSDPKQSGGSNPHAPVDPAMEQQLLAQMGLKLHNSNF